MEEKPHSLSIYLAGNPNSGKTSLFNHITGLRQHTGNYPGVTVDIKEGSCKVGETDLRVVDLPGTYNLTSYSADEKITRKLLTNEPPNIVIDVVDATNLERNLYLAVQIRELGLPIVIALNMSDVAKRTGIRIDTGLLSKNIGFPVIPTVGNKGTGTKELLLENQKAIPTPNLWT